MTPSKPSTGLSVCVYCGSRDGLDPLFGEAARALGSFIGRSGWRLVYGGGRAGLMGQVADATLAAGGSVFGVIPQSLMTREVGHTGLSELRVVNTMHERKQAMAEAADLFLALPGGIGTFEELFEVWTWRQLGYHDKPVGLLNVAGYYDRLLEFLDHSQQQGLVDAGQRRALEVDTDPVRLALRLGELARKATAPDDYRRI
jgi:uncharacterized protein (TIGR00730 family)